jgi:glycosyltransferase involved in cell wall biosynthesis
LIPAKALEKAISRGRVFPSSTRPPRNESFQDQNKSKKVVMLLSNPATSDQRPLREAHALAADGVPVTILAWDRERETKLDTRFSDGLVVKRMRLRAGHGTPMYTVPKLFVFYVWCLAHLVGKRVNAIHCHDVDTLPVGFIVHALKLGRVKLVYDMHDLPEVFLRFFPLVSLTQKITFTFCRRFVDMIVIVAESSIGYLGRRGFTRSKLTVVTNTPSISEASFRVRRGLELRVFYYGWLGKERGVDSLLKAAQILPNVTLTLAGRGELENRIKRLERDFPNLKYLGWLDARQIDAEARNSDLLPTLYEPRNKNAQLAIPGKLMTAMSLAMPCLVPAGSFQETVVSRFNCGLVVNVTNASEVLEAIRRLGNDADLYNKLGKAGYDAFRDNFSWEVMASRLVGAYRIMLAISA